MSSKQRTPRERTTRRESAGRRSRGYSPLSPVRASRSDEKSQLQSLNDRLAVYIETVARLQNENDRLKFEEEQREEIVSREIRSVKTLYETELNDARRLLDETSKDKTAAVLEAQKLKRDNEELLADKIKLQRLLREKEKALEEIETKFNELQPRAKRLGDENRDLRLENDKLKKRLADTQKKLEEETLMKVDLTNQLTTSKEILDFKRQEYENKITEVKSLRTVELSEVDGKMTRIAAEYEKQVQDAINELRVEHEDNLRKSLEEMEDRYETQIEDLKTQGRHSGDEFRKMREEMIQSRSKAEEASARLAGLLAQVEDLQKKLDDERMYHMNVIAKKDEEIQRLLEQREADLAEYQALLGVKIGLDAEIAAYRKMLEGEEKRLNISLTPGRQDGSDTPTRPSKRKRTVLETEESEQRAMDSNVISTGLIEIAEDDAEGKFVKLQNKGDDDVPLAGWVIKRSVGDEEISYKFTRAAHITGGSFLTIWSSGQDVTANPENIIMRNKTWIVGDSMTTVLNNREGNELSKRVSSRQQASSSHTVERHVAVGSRRQAVELYHQEGDPGNRENCSIM